MNWLVGIDEAGRGPLAGPVAVGVVMIPTDFDWSLIPGVGDSKKIAPKNREAIFGRALELKGEGRLKFHVALVSPAVIDSKGIVAAIRQGMLRGLKALETRGGATAEALSIKLDGGLTAPTRYLKQETIIKGDSLEPVIGLASILAKVTRDRYMARMAASPPFAPYRFDLHKGYGTKLHRELIKKHGLSVIHRRSFCQNLTVPTNDVNF